MTNTPASLEIRVHLVSGAVHSFVQDDSDAIRRMLEMVSPQKLFQQRVIMVGGTQSVTGFPTTAVTRVDFVMEGLPAFYSAETVNGSHRELIVISEEEFLERLPAVKRNDVEGNPSAVAGLHTALGRIDLASGEPVFCEVHANAAQKLEQRVIVQHLFALPFLLASLQGNGVCAINMAQVARIVFHPGPELTPGESWVAEPMDV